MNNLIASLREHTLPQHAQLENVTRLPQSLESSDDLRRVLVTFLGYYEALDPVLQVASVGVLPREISNRPWRSHVLREDLMTMGFDEKNLADLPVCTSLPTTLTTYHVWGIHYVIEGSALGGKVISSHMKKHPSLIRWVGMLRFFDIYGRDTTTRWKSFMAELEKLNPTKTEQAHAVEGAQMAFSVLTEWFQEHDNRASIAD